MAGTSGTAPPPPPPEPVDPAGKRQREVVSYAEEDRRKRGFKNRLMILAPLIAFLYNLFMGGVDRADALRAAFTTRLKSNKWWQTLFFWVLDTALINSYIYYRACKPSICLTRHEYYARIAERLICRGNDGDEADSPTTGAISATSAPLKNKWKATPHGVHCVRQQPCDKLYPARWTGDGSRGQCRYCLAMGHARLPVVNTGCSTCQTSLCVECMGPWHDMPLGKKTKRA
ncbi:hypothetical protein NFJ02_08g137620 [Pycnococcus provasolii]